MVPERYNKWDDAFTFTLSKLSTTHGVFKFIIDGEGSLRGSNDWYTINKPYCFLDLNYYLIAGPVTITV